MNRLRAGMSAGGVLLLALCGPFSAPPVHAEEDPRRAILPPGKAMVFIFRSDREPRAALVPVVVNARRAGDLADGTFLAATVDPGHTFLRAGDRVLTSLRFEAAANQSYFVQLEAVHGMTVVQAEMRLVSEAEGRSSLEQSRWAGPVPAATAAAPGASQPGASQPGAVFVPASAESDRSSEIVLIAKGGRFKLAQPQQLLGGFPSTFEAASKPVYGIELEWRGSSGFAAGAELFYYRNNLVLDGTTLTGQQDVAAFMLNAKYYLHAADWFYPYVGAGGGFASARYSGDVTGKASGAAYQGLAGIELRFGHVGLNMQYKYFSSTIEDASGVRVKVGGKGALAGLSIIF
ncbi:MAG TPA: outer membrane beta-barrel protein [Burkholderiales bacterium]|nr:outer membrane beta-barrel protein [Burkholderiales bacterium]